MRKNMILNVIFLTALVGLTGCYKMPCDDDCSLVPTTNNPNVTWEKGGCDWLPDGSLN